MVLRRAIDTLAVSALDLLGAARIFQGVDRDALRALREVAVDRSYERGERVVFQDAPKPGLFLLRTGRARSLAVGANGRELVTRLLKPGDTFADVATFGGLACASAVEVLEPSRCHVFPFEQVDAWLAAHPAACRVVLRNVCGLTESLVRRLVTSATMDADARVAAFLREQGGDLRWGKGNVALFLGISGETFSRSLRRLTEARILGPTEERRIEILDAETLDVIAEGTRKLSTADL